MKKTKLFAYVDGDTFIHRLSGVSKLICFLLLTFAAMLTYDIRMLIGLVILTMIFVKISGLSLRRYKWILGYLTFFMALNVILTFFLDPYWPCEVLGSRHDIYAFNENYVLTQEAIYYFLCKIVKYFCIMPMGLSFFATVHPSEFASSLNGIKVPYRACTVFSLAMRYLPDIQNDFHSISLAQQARGLDTSHKAPVKDRIVNNSKILIPLVFSTLDRVEMITNALELRGYGKAKTRTWYSFRPLVRNDYLAIAFCAACLIFVLFMRFVVVGSMFWNPLI